MGAERQVMQEYFDTLIKRADYPALFTEDVVATFEGTDQRAEGREAAGQRGAHLFPHEPVDRASHGVMPGWFRQVSRTNSLTPIRRSASRSYRG